MKYLKLYEQFRLIKESISGKKLILFSGPSASGKSTLAKKLGATDWYENLSSVVLVGTDNFGGGKYFEDFAKLLRERGMNTLVDTIVDTIEDWAWTFGQSDGKKVNYKKEYEEWKKTAPVEEVEAFEELCKKYPLTISQTLKNNAPHNHEDGRITGMAWCADLLPDTCKTIIFDDICVGIKAYFEDQITEWILFTPLDWLLKNIESRNLSENKAEHININDEGTAIYQYCTWWQATDKPDLDNKMYTAENVRTMLIAGGHENPDEILDLLGVSEKLEDGFYITAKPWIDKSTMIINTRDKSSGRAVDVPTTI
jgi:SpoVK/Ycf46/Vps4 family AAA+-type ATPase